MKAEIFGEVKVINGLYGTPPAGQFALETLASPHWDHCREQFLGKMKNDLQGFYFSHGANQSENIAYFLAKFEEILEITDFSSFQKTNISTILWVIPSKFWMNCVLKKSLLTLLLRVGINYNPETNNFDEALFSDGFAENKYARETKNAIMRFLFGFTEYRGTIPGSDCTWDGGSTLMKHGWHAEFVDAGIPQVCRKLVRSKNTIYEPISIGIESLWA